MPGSCSIVATLSIVLSPVTIAFTRPLLEISRATAICSASASSMRNQLRGQQSACPRFQNAAPQGDDPKAPQANVTSKSLPCQIRLCLCEYSGANLARKHRMHFHHTKTGNIHLLPAGMESLHKQRSDLPVVQLGDCAGVERASHTSSSVGFGSSIASIAAIYSWSRKASPGSSEESGIVTDTR